MLPAGADNDISRRESAVALPVVGDGSANEAGIDQCRFHGCKSAQTLWRNDETKNLFEDIA